MTGPGVPGGADRAGDGSNAEAIDDPEPDPGGDDSAGDDPGARLEVARETRWRVGLLVAVGASLLAVALGAPALFALAIVGLGFVLVGVVGRVPDEPRVRVERRLDEDRPCPGASVTVTVTVHNDGNGVAPDVRVVDEPPEGVPVTAGSPAFATAVGPGESATHEYELTPPRGEYAFGTPTVRRRSVTATARATDDPPLSGASSFTCETLLDGFPAQDRTIQWVGRRPTEDGGSGVEFFATREYRQGDPINRIDWYRYARTGDLATVEYREERAVTIVFVIDDRDGVHRQPPGGGPDSYDLSLYAASRGVVASLEDGNRTGFATLTGDVLIGPGGDDGVRRRVEAAIADRGGSGTGTKSPRRTRPVTDGGARADAATDDPDDGGDPATVLAERLPRNAQVVFCTPLSDRTAVEVVRRLRQLGRDVTVISPDPTTAVAGTADAPGARIAGLERGNRVATVRGVGAAVVDWSLDEPLAADLARVVRSRSRAGAGGGSR